MNEDTKELFEEFFKEENWFHWGTEMDFLKEKIYNRMEQRSDDVERLIADFKDSA